MPIGTTNSKRNMICDFCCLSVITSAHDVYSDLIFRHFKQTTELSASNTQDEVINFQDFCFGNNIL